MLICNTALHLLPPPKRLCFSPMYVGLFGYLSTELLKNYEPILTKFAEREGHGHLVLVWISIQRRIKEFLKMISVPLAWATALCYQFFPKLYTSFNEKTGIFIL